MKKLIILFVLTSSALFAQTLMDSLARYHPYNIGNEWIYSFWGEGKYHYSKKIVVGDTIINSKKYFRIERNYSENSTLTVTYERIDTANGVVYQSDYDGERMLDSLLATDGDEFDRPFTRLCDSIRSQNIFTLPTSVRYIELRVVPFPHYYRYAYGFGEIGTIYISEDPIYPRTTSTKSTLVYVKINGKEFGTKAGLIADSLSQYHPMHNGNEWVYKKISNTPPDTTYIRIKKIQDTLIGTKWYSVLKKQDLKTASVQLLNQRFDSATGNFYEGTNFSENVVDSTVTTDSTKLFPVSIQYNVNYLGLTTTQRLFDYGNIDNINYTTYAWGLGKTSSYWYHAMGAYTDEKLVYAMINGKEYGTNPLIITDSLSLYHPLHNGNIWMYQHRTVGSNDITLLTIEVLGDSLINNTMYKMLEKRMADQVLFSNIFDRFDLTNGAYYQLYGGEGAEEMILDSTLTSEPNTMFGGIFNNRMFVSVAFDSLFGTTAMTRTIEEGALIKEDRITWRYSYGIGLVEEYDQELGSLLYKYHDKILYAKINGIEYGVNPLFVKKSGIPLPVSFSLSQNYPNPFNPSTTFRFDIASRSTVTLKIYDALGREVATPINESMDAGTYTSLWNAGNFASGVYYYRLTAGSFVQTRKLLLLK